MRSHQGISGGMWCALGVAAAVLLCAAAAQARPMHVMASTPGSGAVMQGRLEQYVVRFDGPVDHAASRRVITRDGKVVQSLHTLLDSAPEVLFASSRTLPPGQYLLHWTVRSMAEGDMSEGDIPFSVTK